MKNLCKRKFFSVDFLCFSFFYALIFASFTLLSLRCAEKPGDHDHESDAEHSHTQQTQQVQQTQQTQQTQQNQSQQSQTGAPTYNRDVKPILDGKCVGCHGKLSSYDGVVNGEGSGSCSGRKYVVKGAPDSSLIYLKITNPPCGDKMPKGGSLSQSEIETIKNWISGGAPES